MAKTPALTLSHLQCLGVEQQCAGLYLIKAVGKCQSENKSLHVSRSKCSLWILVCDRLRIHDKTSWDCVSQTLSIQESANLDEDTLQISKEIKLLRLIESVAEPWHVHRNSRALIWDQFWIQPGKAFPVIFSLWKNCFVTGPQTKEINLQLRTTCLQGNNYYCNQVSNTFVKYSKKEKLRKMCRDNAAAETTLF